MHVAHYWVQFGIHTAWSVPVQLGGWVARLMLPTWRPHEVVCREGHLLHLPLHQTRVRQLADVGGSLALGACCSGYIASLPYLTLGRFFPFVRKSYSGPWPGFVCVYACECAHVRVCAWCGDEPLVKSGYSGSWPGFPVLSQTAIVWF